MISRMVGFCDDISRLEDFVNNLFPQPSFILPRFPLCFSKPLDTSDIGRNGVNLAITSLDNFFVQHPAIKQIKGIMDSGEIKKCFKGSKTINKRKSIGYNINAIMAKILQGYRLVKSMNLSSLSKLFMDDPIQKLRILAIIIKGKLFSEHKSLVLFGIRLLKDSIGIKRAHAFKLKESWGVLWVGPS